MAPLTLNRWDEDARCFCDVTTQLRCANFSRLSALAREAPHSICCNAALLLCLRKIKEYHPGYIQIYTVYTHKRWICRIAISEYHFSSHKGRPWSKSIEHDFRTTVVLQDVGKSGGHLIKPHQSNYNQTSAGKQGMSHNLAWFGAKYDQSVCGSYGSVNVRPYPLYPLKKKKYRHHLGMDQHH